MIKRNHSKISKLLALALCGVLMFSLPVSAADDMGESGGVSVNLCDTSVWTLTDDCELISLNVASGASIQDTDSGTDSGSTSSSGFGSDSGSAATESSSSSSSVTDGVVIRGKKQMVTVGKKKYIVNKKGIVQKNKKAIKAGKNTYSTNKKGVATLKK